MCLVAVDNWLGYDHRRSSPHMFVRGPGPPSVGIWYSMPCCAARYSLCYNIAVSNLFLNRETELIRRIALHLALCLESSLLSGDPLKPIFSSTAIVCQAILLLHQQRPVALHQYGVHLIQQRSKSGADDVQGLLTEAYPIQM